jgi:hypothetical protein
MGLACNVVQVNALNAIAVLVVVETWNVFFCCVFSTTHSPTCCCAAGCRHVSPSCSVTFLTAGHPHPPWSLPVNCLHPHTASKRQHVSSKHPHRAVMKWRESQPPLWEQLASANSAIQVRLRYRAKELSCSFNRVFLFCFCQSVCVSLSYRLYSESATI